MAQALAAIRAHEFHRRKPVGLLVKFGNEFADLYEEGQSEAERFRARLLLKNLIYPEGMGEAFRVLIQHKGVENPRLTGLQPL